MTWHDSLNSTLGASWSKQISFALCLAPAAIMAWTGLHSGLSPAFRELAVHRTGEWTLKFLLLTLAVTPLRQFAGLSNFIRFRRMLGLFSFFYGCLHFLTWRSLHPVPGVEQVSVWNLRLAFLGFVLMIPLAATSTAASIRWLGGKRWRLIHSLIYGSAILGYIHYSGLARSGILKQIILAMVMAFLLIVRLRHARPSNGQTFT